MALDTGKTSNIDCELNKVEHSTLYTAYRVVVHRLNLPDTIHLTEDRKPYNGVVKSLDDLLSLDPSSRDFQRISRLISQDKENLKEILTTLYTSITDVLDSDQASINQLYQEIDITPLVTQINTSLTIDGINTCNIVCVDPELTDFDATHLDKFLRNSPWYSLISENLDQNCLLEDLTHFKFREFDLVRVYVYSDKEKSLYDHIINFQKSFESWKSI